MHRLKTNKKTTKKNRPSSEKNPACSVCFQSLSVFSEIRYVYLFSALHCRLMRADTGRCEVSRNNLIHVRFYVLDYCRNKLMHEVRMWSAVTWTLYERRLGRIGDILFLGESQNHLDIFHGCLIQKQMQSFYLVHKSML